MRKPGTHALSSTQSVFGMVINMTISVEDLLNSIMASLDRFSYIRYEDIPNIDLYMDQVTTFMDERLRATTRNPGEDKILTKTMINNYAKNDLLPPPVKKKYSREHVLVLIMIYYLKGVLSFNDIQTLLEPVTSKYFDKKEGFTLQDIYKEVFNIEDIQKESLKSDIALKIEHAEKMFADAPKEDEEFFVLFALIIQLGFDVYAKRLLMEKILDGYREKHSQKPEPKKKKEPKTE